MILLESAESLSTIIDACDVMIVDPPYSAHVHASATSVGTDGKRNVRKRDLGFESLGNPLQALLADYSKKVKRWSVIYSDFERAHTWIPLTNYVRAVPWVRWSQPQLSGDRPAQGFEMLLLTRGCAPGRMHWSGPGGLVSFDHEEDVPELPGLRHAALRGEGKHPTEKPLDQLLDLVSWFSDPGEVVVDPCAGRCTTALACKILGREFVGAELQAEERARGTARVEGTLSERDAIRLDRWIDSAILPGPEPADPMQRKTWERACRRAADQERAKVYVRT